MRLRRLALVLALCVLGPAAAQDADPPNPGVPPPEALPPPIPGTIPGVPPGHSGGLTPGGPGFPTPIYAPPGGGTAVPGGGLPPPGVGTGIGTGTGATGSGTTGGAGQTGSAAPGAPPGGLPGIPGIPGAPGSAGSNAILRVVEDRVLGPVRAMRERGRSLFASPTLGRNTLACATCHRADELRAVARAYPRYNPFLRELTTLEQAQNACLKRFMNGAPLPAWSRNAVAVSVFLVME